MNHMLKITVIAVVAGFVAVSLSLAEQKEGGDGKKWKKDPAKVFARIDKDGSGSLSLEEFTVAHEKRMAAMKERRGDVPEEDHTPPPAAEIFARMDADKNGSISEAEFFAGRPGKHHDKKPE